MLELALFTCARPDGGLLFVQNQISVPPTKMKRAHKVLSVNLMLCSSVWLFSPDVSIFNNDVKTLCDRTTRTSRFFFFLCHLSFKAPSLLLSNASPLRTHAHKHELRSLRGNSAGSTNLRKRTRDINKGSPGKHGPPAADHRRSGPESTRHEHCGCAAEGRDSLSLLRGVLDQRLPVIGKATGGGDGSRCQENRNSGDIGTHLVRNASGTSET